MHEVNLHHAEIYETVTCGLQETEPTREEKSHGREDEGKNRTGFLPPRAEPHVHGLRSGVDWAMGNFWAC